MKKFWLVFLHEYKRHVLRKRFIFAVLSMPFFVCLMIGIGFLSVWLQYDNKPVGYIDPYQILVDPQQVPEEEKTLLKKVESIAYPNEDSAKTALENGDIQAYFIFSDHYYETGKVTMKTISKTSSNAKGDFGDFVSYNLTKGLPEPVFERLSDGNNITIRSLDGSREMGSDNWMVMMLPLIAGVLFIIAVNISDSVYDVQQRMRESGRWAVPVIEDGYYRGIFTTDRFIHVYRYVNGQHRSTQLFEQAAGRLAEIRNGLMRPSRAWWRRGGA